MLAFYKGILMYKFGFVGMGNMASAITQGFVESGFIPGKEICAYDLNKAQLDKMSSFGIVALNDAHEVVKKVILSFYVLNHR